MIKKILFSIVFFAAAAGIAVAALQGMQQKAQAIPAGEVGVCLQTVTEELQRIYIAEPPEILRVECPELAAGEERVLKQGSSGLTVQTVKIVSQDGKELSRSVLSSQTVRPGTDTLLACGAAHYAVLKTHNADPVAEGGILTTPEGEQLHYTRILSCTATAYSCEGYTGTTAIGTTARVGAVAVDPDYIPYGTKMYIVSDDGAYLYGYATAEDCGNFRGYHLDLYFNTIDECWIFGRRTCTVYILSEG